MLRIPYDDLYAALERACEHLGLRGERGQRCARLFAETTRDGVYTHGLNRFPRFAATVANGCTDVSAVPSRADSDTAGTNPLAIERWNGNLGVGNLNAYAAMERSIGLARQFGLGAVAMANTNHWMRGGSYGWQAAEAGSFAMCWTNTLANLPPWGASTPALGNNPLVIAAPRANGAHVVLDMAMSQFSYGTLTSYAARGALLPVPGGFEQTGELTRDPVAIEASRRALPVGYWKGSGLSLLLDLFAAMLSGGHAVNEIPIDSLRESGLSQFFLAVDPANLAARAEMERIADGAVAAVRAATPIVPGQPARYPGEQTLHLREENLRLGVPVESGVWHSLLALKFEQWI
ncbi:MAG TPA: 3-dehydro-L-gulonate 2-dehydrogenase [Acidobacteriaceae bacterium]|nr:3-dehydro-L-gulonate 2-dehydrogenase [Acidobacteriaceae bacterium]